MQNKNSENFDFLGVHLGALEAIVVPGAVPGAVVGNHKVNTVPSLTTAIPDRASGTLTPAAMKVRPMTVSGIPNVKPMTVIIHTITYEYNEIQQMEACKKM